MGIKKKTLSVQPQYNICEHYLNQNTFIHVLKTCCPNIVVQIINIMIKYK